MKMRLVLLVGLASCGTPSAHAGTAGRAGDAHAQPFPQNIQLCSVEGGRLVYVSGALSADGRDTLLSGRSLREIYHGASTPFATRQSWFQAHLPIELEGRTYFKNSPPRRFAVDTLVNVGEFGTTPLFVEFGARTKNPSIIYVLIDATCLFQAYYYSG